MPDDFSSDSFDGQALEDHRYDEMDGEDLAPEEVAEAFFGYNEDQFGFRWFGNLIGLGVLVAYLMRLTELVFNSDRGIQGFDPDPSPIRLLAAAGDVFSYSEAGLIVLLGAALVVRFRPANDGVRATLRLAAIVILVGSVASVLGSYFADTSVSISDAPNWKVAALRGAGVAALQAGVALATLKSERQANRIPAFAIVGLLASATMGFGVVFVSGWADGALLGDSDTVFYGAAFVRQSPLIAAAVLVSLTGWAKVMRTVVLSVSVAVFALAIGFLVTSLRQNVDEWIYFGSTASYVSPPLVLAALTAFGLASMPFVRTAPKA